MGGWLAPKDGIGFFLLPINIINGELGAIAEADHQLLLRANAHLRVRIEQKSEGAKHRVVGLGVVGCNVGLQHARERVGLSGWHLRGTLAAGRNSPILTVAYNGAIVNPSQIPFYAAVRQNCVDFATVVAVLCPFYKWPLDAIPDSWDKLRVDSNLFQGAIHEI